MIDPHHQCWWTRKKLTEMCWQGIKFLSAGVSLRVLLSALYEPDLIWYSIVYGDYDDNITVIAVDELESKMMLQERHANGGPVTQSAEDLFTVTEYVLSDKVAAAFGIVIGNEFGAECSSAVRYLVTIHDDCFAQIYPATPTTVRRLVMQTLQLHSFYLQRDFEWDQVVGELVELLQSSSRIALESKTGRSGSKSDIKMNVSVNAGRASKFQEVGYIDLDGHVAMLKLKTQT